MPIVGQKYFFHALPAAMNIRLSNFYLTVSFYFILFQILFSVRKITRVILIVNQVLLGIKMNVAFCLCDLRGRVYVLL